MSDLERDALRVSAVLDDGGEGSLDARFAGQGRVHAGLSVRGAAPCERPQVDIRSRVMMKIGEAAPARRAWPVAMAASLTLMAGIGWVVMRSMQPAPVVAPELPRVAVTSSKGAGPAIASLLNPFKGSDPQIRASLDGNFEAQAKLIQQDTQQGMEMVLSRLPLGTGQGSGQGK
jgi:hypothetical protein